MKVLKGFNNISEELAKTITPLKGIKTFRLLTGVTIFDPETRTSKLHFAKTLIPTKDRIKDPFTKNYVDIGVVSEFDASTGEVLDTRRFITGLNQSVFNGLFDLHEGKVDDEELWEFLCISNFNKSNKHRDQSRPAMFELIDVYADSKQQRKKRSDLTDALNIAQGMGLPEIREFALSCNQSDMQEEDILRDFVESYAEQNPTEFILSFKNPVFKIQAVIKRSMGAGFIQHEASTGKVKWTDAKGTTITTVSKEDGKDWIVSFAEYCYTSPAGEAVLKGLKKKLKETAIAEVSEETA